MKVYTVVVLTEADVEIESHTFKATSKASAEKAAQTLVNYYSHRSSEKLVYKIFETITATSQDIINFYKE